MVQFSSIIERGKEEPPNTACTGRLVGPAKKANLGEQLFLSFRQLVLASRR